MEKSDPVLGGERALIKTRGQSINQVLAGRNFSPPSLLINEPVETPSIHAFNSSPLTSWSKTKKHPSPCEAPAGLGQMT